MLPLFEEQGVSILELRPRYDSLDENALGELDESLCDAAARADAPRILLDLSKTEFISSGFIEVLLRASRRIADQHGQIALCEPSPFCRDVLATMRLDTLWPIFARRDQAVKTLAKL